jgi:hypothetical protein
MTYWNRTRQCHIAGHGNELMVSYNKGSIGSCAIFKYVYQNRHLFQSMGSYQCNWPSRWFLTSTVFRLVNELQEKFEDTKGVIKNQKSKKVYKKSDNTMAKRNRAKRQTMVDKILNKQNIDLEEKQTPLNTRWIQVLRKGEQLLSHKRYPPCYSG